MAARLNNSFPVITVSIVLLSMPHHAHLQPADMQRNTQRARLRRLLQCKFRADLLLFAALSLDRLRDAGSNVTKHA
ncbi:hypothetical protein Q8F57_034420 [Paraburkholderia terrae]|uniref:hypothetical protein n=1 Tax=Paraburkholderia terrae TaxID=311230 RepID=UPI00296AC8A2|nr:hypothetical protein [Paraburkholderia terrae]MDW3657277.1 hypothetical protein [Paraburkholderia terrae]